MLVKKTEVKKIIVLTIASILLLILLTGIFKLYHDSNYVKSEYDNICPQNYGDAVSLERCYWSYKFEGEALQNAIKAELYALFIVPILIFLASLI